MAPSLSPSSPSAPLPASYPSLPPSSSRTWALPYPGNTIGHLALFNQRMQQKRQFIEWQYTSEHGEGTKSTPVWAVRAFADNECLGFGRGNTKKAARNEAAKEGLTKMGILVMSFPA